MIECPICHSMSAEVIDDPIEGRGVLCSSDECGGRVYQESDIAHIMNVLEDEDDLFREIEEIPIRNSSGFDILEYFNPEDLLPFYHHPNSHKEK